MPQEEKYNETFNNQKNDEKVLGSDKTNKPKKLVSDYFTRNSPSRQESIEKIIQTDEVVQLLDQIMSECSPGDHWYKLAEQKRKELAEVLAENERLFQIKDALLQKNKYYKKRLEEADTFISVFQDVAITAADDTGIESGDEIDSYE